MNASDKATPAREAEAARVRLGRLKQLMKEQNLRFKNLDDLVAGVTRDLRGGRAMTPRAKGAIARAIWDLHEHPEAAREPPEAVQWFWTNLGKEVSPGSAWAAGVGYDAFEEMFCGWLVAPSPLTAPPAAPLAPPADPTAYHEHVFQKLSELPLAAVSPVPDSRSDPRKRMTLAGVYVALDARTPRDAGKVYLDESHLGMIRVIPRLSALEVLAKWPHLVVLGEPGAGKSTFAKHLCVCLAARALKLAGDWAERLGPLADGGGELVPIFIELRRFADALPAPLPSEGLGVRLWKFIQDTLKDDTTLDAAALIPALHQALEQGRALVVFDGLDEVATREKRLAVRDAIQEFVAGNFKRGRVLVTCRTRSYQGRPWQLTEFSGPVELAELDEKKIEQFVGRWYEERKRIDHLPAEDANRFAASLWEAIRDPHFPELIEVARSPLRLTVMALVHHHDGVLPRESARLYARMVDILLFRWENVKLHGQEGAISLSRLLAEAQVRESDFVHELGRLAYTVHERAVGKGSRAPPAAGQARAGQAGGRAEGRESEVLKRDLEEMLARLHPEGDEVWRARVIAIIRERGGLLMEVDDDTFRFPHRLFQEYLAGLHLANTDFLACGSLIDPSRHWWEVVKAAAGWLIHVNELRLGHSAVRDLVKLLAGEQEPAEPVGWLKVILAGEIVVIMRSEALCRLPDGKECLERVKGQLVALIEREALPPPEREQGGLVLGKLGDPRPGVGLDANGLPDIEWITVPAGPFVMGGKERWQGGREFKCNLIRLPYRISRYPITVAQYDAFVKAGGYSDEGILETCWTQAGRAWLREQKVTGPMDWEPVFQTPNHPRVGVTWFEAVAFRWLSQKRGEDIRLPSEAQWERTARGAQGRLYPWGAETDVAERCNVAKAGIGHTSAVGLFPSGDTACELGNQKGLADLAGNVAEWCRTVGLDRYEDYEENVRDELEAEGARVSRGGAWDYYLVYLAPSFRECHLPAERDCYAGFRVVCAGASVQ